MVAAILDVGLHGCRIGTITRLGPDRTIFAFTDEYFDDPARPTLGLHFKDALGELIRDHSPTQVRLLPFFSNLLPEGPLRSYLADRAGVKAVREYPLIAALGLDLPGAVTLTPADGSANLAEAETGKPASARGGPMLRFSLAGVQLKFSAVAAGKLTIPVSGRGGDWIVKLPSQKYDGVPENEFSMMTLARLTGIDVPEVRLVPLGEIAGLPDDLGRLEGDAFAIRRFDRGADGGKIHIEDFAQVFGVYPDDKYKKATYRKIAEVLWIETGEAGVKEFVRRLVFNALIGNADMHLKNWSLIYPDGRTPQLSPGYDFLSTVAHLPDENAALKYARTKRMADLSDEELGLLAVKAGVPVHLALDTAHETVARFREVWAKDAAHLPMPKAVREAVARQLATVAIASEA
jgi:serine/threonine-protein kinase HipA